MKNGFFYLVKSDLARIKQTYALRGQRFSRWKVVIESFLFKAGFQAVFLYRVSHWFYTKKLTYLAWFVSRINQCYTGVEIEFNARIGPGFFIAHSSGIVIGRGTVLGEGATLFQGVNFVVKSWHPEDIKKFPLVGNHCYFFAGAIVMGDITIGDGSVVGCRAVVDKDLPAGSLAAGFPMTVYPGKGEEMIASWNVSSMTCFETKR